MRKEVHARVVLARMEVLRDDELLFLEARIRSWSVWSHDFHPSKISPALFDHRRPMVVKASTAFGSMSPNGYTRQAAVERLDVENQLGIRLCLIRSCDWVPQVAEAAMYRVRGANVGSLVATLPLIEPLVARTRTVELGRHLDAAFSTGSGRQALVSAAMQSADVVSRYAWHRLIRHHPDATSEHVVEAARHPDIRVRQQALELVPQLDGTERDQVMALLSRDPVGRIRVEAIALGLQARQLDVHVIEPLLFDRSRLVRLFGQSQWRKLGRDPRAAYLEAVARDPKRASVAGLGETGSLEDLPTLVGLLASDSEVVRNMALDGLAHIDSSVAREHAYGHLDDSSVRVTRTAIQILGVGSFRNDAMADRLLSRVKQECRPPVRRYLLTALSGSTWHRIGAAVMMRSDVDLACRAHANAAIQLRPSEIATLRRKPSALAREIIEAALPALDPDLRRLIEFVWRT